MTRYIPRMIVLGLLLGLLWLEAAEARALVVKWKNAEFYNRAIAGFSETFGADADIQNCNGSKEDADRILGGAGKYDIVVVFGEMPLKRAVELNVAKPVIYAMVYNPELLVGGKRNITGVSLNIPFSVHVSTIKRTLPNVKKVGVLYSKSELISGLAEAAGGLGIVQTKVTAGKIKEGLAGLKGTDLILITLDPVLATQAAMSSILLFSMENKIPVYAPSDKLVKAGAVLGSMADYSENGRAAGLLASQISRNQLAGKFTLPSAQAMNNGNLYINLKMAKALGITVPANMLKEATGVFE